MYLLDHTDQQLIYMMKVCTYVRIVTEIRTRDMLPNTIIIYLISMVFLL